MSYFKKKAKIVATLGPASEKVDVIRKLALAGVDVFRLNFSHGNHEIHKQKALEIRTIEKEINKRLAIMMDLQGPKIRIGILEKGSACLKKGNVFIFDLLKEAGNSERVCLPHPEVFKSITEGSEMLIDDGRIRLKAIENNGSEIKAKIIEGGEISNKKGVNIPTAVLPIPAITNKDKEDLKILNEIDADWVAVSFVQKAEDILDVKSLVMNGAGILAKIEKLAAIENLDSILEVSDAVMIARGDLGVEIPFESIPGVQKRIIERARFYGKPAIVATQMLESMTSNKFPTRAEVSDVACAVAEGADAVMLSAETASGKHPEEAVKTMEKIIIQAEKDDLSFIAKEIEPNNIAGSMVNVVNYAKTKIIAAFTESGKTAINVSRSRPKSFIVALTPSIKVARKLALAWGVYSIVVEEIFSFSQIMQIAQKKSGENFENEDEIAVIAGIPFRVSGTTNLLHICKIDKDIYSNKK